MSAPGTLVLVVGPSGAGKDTLMNEARAALADDPRFVFVRRVVTREAVAALEDHDSISAEAFAENARRGAYALSWEAHGLHYGLPASIDAALVAGRVVVANTSRAVVSRAMDKYRRCVAFYVDAAPEIRASRLRARGREDGMATTARLARQADMLPADARVIRIDNSGALPDGVARFVSALLAIAAA
jgi:ribose 1,5-bisphosphokinase